MLIILHLDERVFTPGELKEISRLSGLERKALLSAISEHAAHYMNDSLAHSPMVNAKVPQEISHILNALIERISTNILASIQDSVFTTMEVIDVDDETGDTVLEIDCCHDAPED